MALFQVGWTSNPTTFNVRIVRGGSATELADRLNVELAAAIADGEGEMVDFYVSGTGAGLDWQAIFVTASTSINPSVVGVETSLATFVGAEAGNPAEARLRLMQAVAAVPLINAVFKVEVAGAGVDPTYAAIALVDINPGV